MAEGEGDAMNRLHRTERRELKRQVSPLLAEIARLLDTALARNRETVHSLTLDEHLNRARKELSEGIALAAELERSR